MKVTGICILLILCNILIGQGYFLPDADQKISLDQIEIESGKLFQNHIQIKPLNKIRCMERVLRLYSQKVAGGTPATTQSKAADGMPATTQSKAADGMPATTQSKAADGMPATTQSKAADGTPATTQSKAADGTPAITQSKVTDDSNDTARTSNRYHNSTAIQLIKDNIEVLYTEVADSNLSYLKSSKPFLKYFYSDGTHFLSTYKKSFQISLDPLLQFEVGSEKSNLLFINRRGIRLQGSVDQRVFFHSDIIETQVSVPFYVHDYVSQYQTFPGAGLYKIYNSRFPKSDRAYDFLLSEAAVEFNASKHIQISLGHGRHFIGSGIRSMFLSDFSAPQFYLQINTNVWKIHYQNLFTELSPESPSEQGNHLLEKKYMAAHYLSINLTKNWNAGIFESVVFARTNGFELQYLNPVILYRFIEHSLGSPDNVFIGFHSNLLLAKKISLYGQILFDEFVAKEFFSSKGWWGNKYGFQIGCKYIHAFGLKNLFLQVEYNQARPYTYTFRDSISNYSQYHQALAHPLGANFKELIFTINYPFNDRWTISTQLLHFNKGLDSTGINNGGNILLNYESRISDYGNKTTQGISNIVVAGNFRVSYKLFKRAWLDLNLNFRNSKTNNEQQNTFWISGGFRMNLDRMRFDF